MSSNSFIKNIIDLLKKHNLSITTCESVTGGMIISHLIDIAGASEVVKGGIVSYQNEIKIKNVGVNKTTIEKFGVVSLQVANEMAVGISNKMHSDLSIAITGNANNKKDNIAFLCIKVIDKLFNFELLSKESERNNIRIDFTIQSLYHLHSILKNMDK
jgi:PncC family amidohydrolase